jgi:hypothetical protein
MYVEIAFLAILFIIHGCCIWIYRFMEALILRYVHLRDGGIIKGLLHFHFLLGFLACCGMGECIMEIFFAYEVIWFG